MMAVLWSVLVAGALLATVVTAMSGMIWLERRTLAVWQDRKGPNRVGPFGMGVVVADTIKIMLKEDWVPPFADKAVFILAPAMIMVIGILSFAVIPLAPDVSVTPLHVGLLFFLGMSSLNAYTVILAGWSSNNKYSLIGSLRAAGQVMSYEVFMGLALMGVVVMAGSFDLHDIVAAQGKVWNIVPQFLGFILFFIAAIAETHRAPFDLPEAESEIVAGFHSEYSGIKFGMFFLGEYIGVVLMSTMMATLYAGGWNGPFMPGPWWLALKTFGFVFLFILARAALPRPRQDQVLSYGWKVLFPLALLNLLGTAAVVIATQSEGSP